MRRFLAAGLLTLALVGSTAAQSITKTAAASATLTVASSLSLSNTSGLAFGQFAAGTGNVAAPAPARWDGAADVGSSLAITFPSLPTSLTSGANTIPITYGASSAQFTGAGSVLSFNPATGVSAVSPNPTNGTFNVQLGTSSVVGNAGAVQVNISTTTPAGAYAATITLQVVR